MKKVLLMMSLMALSIEAYAQTERIGINESSPTETLHVKDGTLRVTGLPEKGHAQKGKIFTKTDGTASRTKDQNYEHSTLVVTNEKGVIGQMPQGTAGQLLVTLTGGRPSWQTVDLPDSDTMESIKTITQQKPTNQIPDLGTGTVIAIGGKLQIASEIVAVMAENETASYQYRQGSVYAIPHLQKIIDNTGSFVTSATGNGFRLKPEQAGTYQVLMNVHINDATGTSTPVAGLWNETDRDWVVRVSNSNNNAKKTTITLISTVPLVAGKEYSFRTANNGAYTVAGNSSGKTGGGPVTFVSVKRLK